MHFCIIMNDNSYPGREYVRELVKLNLQFDILVIGKYPEISQREEERCSGLWRPPLLTEMVTEQVIHRFESLQSPQFLDFIRTRKYDFAIQGGTGILKNPVIESFRLGILNFHPGRLPQYRGCSAPEWQLWEGQPIVCCCHLVDTGIDTGPIYSSRILNVSLQNYGAFRASVYPEIARFVSDITSEIVRNNGFARELKIQDNEQANYRKYIGDNIIDKLRCSLVPVLERTEEAL